MAKAFTALLPLDQSKRGMVMTLEMFDRVRVKKDLADKKLLAGDEGVVMEMATAKDGTVGYVVELFKGQQNRVWIETLTVEQIELVEKYEPVEVAQYVSTSDI